MVIFVRLSAINLNQIVVKFSQPVDVTAATTYTNYSLGGVDLTTNDKFSLSPADSKTLTINLNSTVAQYGTRVFQVKGNVIYGKNASTSTVPVYTKTLTFSDIALPTVSSVVVSGNRTLMVYFSESVALSSSTPAAGTMFKIDGSYITNFGYSSAAAMNYTGSGYANGITLTFGTAIPAGDHTLTTLAGTATDLVDAAGFKVAEQATSFTVASVTTAPSISSVVAQDNGTITVTFDRSMDNSALTSTNYTVNGVAMNSTGTFRADSNFTIVDFTGNNAAINVGANVLKVISTYTVKDTYGNNLNTTTMAISFTATADTTKPTVSSVVPLTNSKIRVKFSEAVTQAYATNSANYVLKNSAGVQIAVTAAKVAVDTYDLTPATALTGASYTLTIKNIIDTAATGNIMDTYVATFSGSDSTAPQALTAIAANAAYTMVAITFDEPMDAATLATSSNYYYIGRDGVTRVLPSGASVSAGVDNTSATITFPSPYKVDTANGVDAIYDVTGIVVGNVKDVAGNTLLNISKSFATISNYGGGSDNPTYVADTFTATASGANVVVSFQLNQNLTSFDYTDFRVGDTVTDYPATSGYVSGKTVYLTFTTGVSDIKKYGTGLKLYTATTNSKNVYGTPIAAIASGSAITVYDDKIAPALVGVTQSDSKTIKIQFSEPVDATILGLYADDFSIISNGELMAVSNVGIASTAAGVTNDTVVYTLTKATSGDMNWKAVASAINIKSLANDTALTSDLYVPIAADIAGLPIDDSFAPSLLTVVLTNGSASAGLAIGDTMIFTFDEAMAPSTNTGFTMTNGVVAFTTGGKTFTFGTVGVNAGTGTITWNGNVATLTFTNVTTATTAPSGAVTPSATTLLDMDGNELSATASAAATGSF